MISNNLYSTLYQQAQDEMGPYPDLVVKRYGELIVEECMKVCDMYSESADLAMTPKRAEWASGAAKWCARHIQRRFSFDN